jgi:flagellar hook-associated protein 1 FlgK
VSLFGSIQQSANALRVSEVGLQVTGNNISNANTPGYIRQELVQSTAIGLKQGDLILGYGVRAVGVVQKIDEFLLDKLRQTQSELSYNLELQGNNQAIETALSELSENDLSSQMSRFANALHDIANQPGNASLRSLVLQRGRELAQGFDRLSQAAKDIQTQSGAEIRNAALEVNRLLHSIADLNLRITSTEGGTSSNSDAVGLRDERLKALDELSQWIDIRVQEQEDGSTTVLVGGDYLVTNSIVREVQAVANSDDGLGDIEIRLGDTDAPLVISAGKIRGFYDSRSGVSASFLNRIDGIAKSVITAVNLIHAQGQGAVGFHRADADYVVDNEFAPLEEAGLNGEIENGSFVVTVRDARTGLASTHDIFVKQQGFPNDTTALSLVADLDAIAGIRATLSNDGRLQIVSDSEAVDFSFSRDTSGALAALGINTFFQGNSADSIQVKETLLDNPGLLAMSLEGVGNGAHNALRLAEAFENPVDELGGRSIRDLYESMVVEVVQDINRQKGVTEGLQNYYRTLEARHLGITGVSLDEEAIRMLLYQRAFQATSKLITTASELLEVLVNMV